MKKTALALTLILAFLVPSMVNAQTTSYYSPDIDGYNFYLEMYSPNNQTAYNETMLLDFNLQWHWDLIPVAPLSADYAYSIDDNQPVSIVSNQSAKDRYATAPSWTSGFKHNPSFSYLVNVSTLTSGYHKIAISAQLYWDFDRYKQLLYNETTSPVFFSVQNSIPSPTPTPSPEPTPRPETFPASLVFVASVGIAVTVTGLLVYFKKRKP